MWLSGLRTQSCPHEVTASIPSLAQRVKDLALLKAVCKSQIWLGSGASLADVGLQLPKSLHIVQGKIQKRQNNQYIPKHIRDHKHFAKRDQVTNANLFVFKNNAPRSIKVFPEEVEAVLESSNNFAEVCVMGSSRSGGTKDGTEEIVAVIVPKDNYMKE